MKTYWSKVRGYSRFEKNPESKISIRAMELIKQVSERTGIFDSDILGRLGPEKVRTARAIIMKFLIDEGFQCAEVARFFELHPNTVRFAISKLKK